MQGLCLLIRANLALLMGKERKTPPKVILSRPIWKYWRGIGSYKARSKPKFIRRLKDSLGVAKSSLPSWLEDRTLAIEKD